MKTRLLVTVVATAVLGLAPVVPTQAHYADTTTDGLVCDLTGFVVKPPNDITVAGPDDPPTTGIFGRALVTNQELDSTVHCAGAINGTATVGGSFSNCKNDHNGVNGCGDPEEPEVEALYPPSVPGTAHVSGSGTLTGVLGDWKWDDGHAAPNCTFTFSGHALAPVELTINMACGAGNTFVFPRTNAIRFAVLLDASGDVVHARTADQNPDFQHCQSNSNVGHTDPAGNTWNQTNGGTPPRCFRAVMFSGTIAGVK